MAFKRIGVLIIVEVCMYIKALGVNLYYKQSMEQNYSKAQEYIL